MFMCHFLYVYYSFTYVNSYFKDWIVYDWKSGVWDKLQLGLGKYIHKKSEK